VFVRPRTAVLQKLRYKVIEQRAVRSSLVHTQQQDAILSICCQDLMSPVAVKSSHLNGGRANGRPAGAPSADAFIAARLVNEDELVGPKLQDLVEVVALEIRILFPYDLPSGLLRPLDGRQRPAYACPRHIDAELVVHKTSHLILIQSRFCEKLFAKSIEHVRRHGPTPTHPGRGSLGIVVAVHVLLQPLDRAPAAPGFCGHLGGIQLSVLEHPTNLPMLRGGERRRHCACVG
jgi:hypothetical protein